MIETAVGILGTVTYVFVAMVVLHASNERIAWSNYLARGHYEWEHAPAARDHDPLLVLVTAALWPVAVPLWLISSRLWALSMRLTPDMRPPEAKKKDLERRIAELEASALEQPQRRL